MGFRTGRGSGATGPVEACAMGVWPRYLDDDIKVAREDAIYDGARVG